MKIIAILTTENHLDGNNKNNCRDKSNSNDSNTVLLQASGAGSVRLSIGLYRCSSCVTDLKERSNHPYSCKSFNYSPRNI